MTPKRSRNQAGRTGGSPPSRSNGHTGPVPDVVQITESFAIQFYVVLAGASAQSWMQKGVSAPASWARNTTNRLPASGRCLYQLWARKYAWRTHRIALPMAVEVMTWLREVA